MLLQHGDCRRSNGTSWHERRNRREPRSRARGKAFALRDARMRAIALLWLVGCSYGPGSFAWPGQHFPGERATVGCLDIAVLRRPDMTEGEMRSAVLEYQFGNRCNHHVVVDLVRVP